MPRSLRFIVLSMLTLGLAAAAGADLNALVADLNLQAKDDLSGFAVKLGAQFAIPVPRVEALIGQVGSPADAFLCLQLGALSDKPLNTVMAAYKAHKGKGWGSVAQELGIKPGSKAFNALKNGKFTLTGESPAKGKGGGHGQGKAKGKDK